MAIMATTTRGTRRTRNTRTTKTEAPAPVAEEPQVETPQVETPAAEPQVETPAEPKAARTTLRWTFPNGKDEYDDGKTQFAPSPFGGSYAITGETGSWTARYTDVEGNEHVLSENGSFGKAYNACVKHHKGLKPVEPAPAAS
jgi:hypothetical protein